MNDDELEAACSMTMDRATDLAVTLETIGLHTEHIQVIVVGQSPSPEDRQPMYLGVLRVGPLAYSERVQQPEVVEERRVLRPMERELDTDGLIGRLDAMKFDDDEGDV